DAEAGLARVQIDDCSCEFPIADPRLHGSDQDFVFLMANDRVGENLPYRDIVKCPVSAGGIGQRDVWCSEGLVGEPTFAPREPANDAGDAGWLLVQLYLPGEHRTQFVILDAANVGAGPVCRLHLPHPVPFGFHTTFGAEVLSG
ncbi:MAG: carotenoid oxygenase family protein, partial [Myxococcota bacterium]|nr:carotenoid oxygenase family protein [Myxococcota bacterium]